MKCSEFHLHLRPRELPVKPEKETEAPQEHLQTGNNLTDFSLCQTPLEESFPLSQSFGSDSPQCIPQLHCVTNPKTQCLKITTYCDCSGFCGSTGLTWRPLLRCLRHGLRLQSFEGSVLDIQDEFSLKHLCQVSPSGHTAVPHAALGPLTTWLPAISDPHGHPHAALGFLRPWPPPLSCPHSCSLCSHLQAISRLS